MGLNENILDFFKFVYERHNIYIKKEVLKENRPWTNDPILDKYLFCNVSRILDKGTRYILGTLENIPDDEDKLLNIVLYRMFNKFNFFEEILNGEYLLCNNYNRLGYEHLLDNKLRTGHKLYGSAYLTSQFPTDRNYRKHDKHAQMLIALEKLVNKINNENYLDRLKVSKPLEAIEIIKEIPLVGDFLAGQILVDLTYIKLVPFTNDEFCIVGPGADSGIKIILEDKELTNEEKIDFCYQLKVEQNLWIKSIDPLINWPNLPVMDIQASLCEYRKYSNIKRSLVDKNFRCKKRFYKGAK